MGACSFIGGCMAYLYSLTLALLFFAHSAHAACVAPVPVPPAPDYYWQLLRTEIKNGQTIYVFQLFQRRSDGLPPYAGTVQEYAAVCTPDGPCTKFKGGKDWMTISGKSPLVSKACATDVGGSGGPSCGGSFSPGIIAKNRNTGLFETSGEITYSGDVCTPTPSGPNDPSSTPSPCKGIPGTVNNMPVCLPYPPDITKVSNSDKTNTTTTSTPNPSDPNAPPSTSETTTTKTTNTQCEGSKCTTTTTTTTTPPNSPPITKTEVEEQDKKSFCDENPNLSICVTSSFSGSCGGPPSCEGDAIQCAIAADQIARHCKMFDDHSTSEEALFNAEKNKGGSVTANLPGNENISIGPGNFDTSDAIGGGAGCIGDKVITVAGQTVTVPLSRVCEYLAILGNALMLFSFVLAGRIVGRG
jgi:hypothetical protein